ncbi:four-carbon acid sugar kinase family protein [Marisediminicola senii]|uniref:four-carbon acid sugar kinase family protein n=1 Tax=Marisediminicola senii TaxID=2711233 RepID=UPI0013EC94A2|nr:four-carbon acid sugar kinase family protein [Marisediminicola senii]
MTDPASPQATPPRALLASTALASIVLAEFPAEREVDPAEVRATVEASGVVLVVLDDDPTGTQSVADLPVLTAWERSDIHWGLRQGAPAIYVLTNTRSLDPATAQQRNREIVQNTLAASAELGVPVAFVSRSDSTLRGHFPLETDTIAATLADSGADAIDGVVIVPAFPDAGRVTIGGTHYMRSGDELTPVAETEFARDATFGFTSSDLREYVDEKTAGRVRAADVVTLHLGIIRAGTEAIADALRDVTGGTPIVVDAVTENDLRALALGLAAAEAAGKRFLYRVGPPFVRARIGQAVRAPLTAAEVYGPAGSDAVGGLVVVGSHVGVTTRQLARLTASRPVARVLEVDIAAVLDDALTDAHLDAVVADATAALATGDVVIHTSRTLRTADDAAASLDISRRVSAAIVRVVQLILAARPPRFVVAKGGITSSDVAAHGLGIRHAIVRGPMLPGIVSLWEPVDGPARGIPYIVFAGNVGDDDSLARVVETLAAPSTTHEKSSHVTVD